MINLAISIIASAAVFALFYFVIPAGAVWGAIFAVAVFAGLNFFMSKRIMNKVQENMETAGKILQGGKFELAIKTMEESLKYSSWMVMIGNQIKAQIGTVQFLKKDYKAALPNLVKTSSKNWVAMGMLGVIYFRNKEQAKMIKTFEKGVKSNSGEAVLWNLYAYCLNKSGERDKAIELLNRAVKKVKDDERTASNLKALQNNAKMKMKSYGESWYQFHLETVPMSMRIQAGARGGKSGRRIVRQ